MKLTNHDKNMILEIIGSFTLSLAFFYSDIVSFVAGFFGFLAVIDLLNTNLRRLKNE